MRAPNFQLLVMSVVLVVSAGLGWPAASGTKECSGLSLTHSNVASIGNLRQARKKRTFKYVDHSCESGCIEFYESSDGQQVSWTLACHTSTGREARRDMQQMISEGRIIKKGWRYYRYGKRRKLGPRTVAIYPPDETGEKPAKIFWYVGGACYDYIEAGSLELALEFERSDAFAKAMEQ